MMQTEARIKRIAFFVLLAIPLALVNIRAAQPGELNKPLTIILVGAVLGVVFIRMIGL